VNDTTREVGAALGVAVVGSVAASGYTASMQSASLPGPALPDAIRGAVNDNIAAAITVGGDFGLGGTALTQLAREAFVNSMGSALWVAAAIAAWATVVALVHLPRPTRAHINH
jgi:hypothetical protein